MADDGTTELSQNQRGELWVRGQNVMKGYWKKPEATKETKTADGWLKTGDIAYVDADGKFHVVDRKKVSVGNIWPVQDIVLAGEHVAKLNMLWKA